MSTCLLFVLLHALCPSGARADAEPAAAAAVATARKAKPPIIGAGVPELAPLSGQAAKGTMYLLAAVLIAVSLHKRFRAPKNGSVSADAIQLISRKSIGPRTSLLLVAAEGSKLLLAQSGDTVTLLSALESASGFDETLAHLAAFENAADAPVTPLRAQHSAAG
jgi:flagellar biogenesis protein FliO